MADGLHWVGACVDNGEHGGDDPEEEAGHHAAEEGNDNDESINNLLGHSVYLNTEHYFVSFSHFLAENDQKVMS